MYRNISYKIDKDTWEGRISIYTWDEHGNRIKKEVKHSSHITYEVDNETELKSIFGTNCERKYFNNSNDRNRFKTKLLGTKIYESFPPEFEYLRANFLNIKDTDEFSKYPLKIHYQDLEIAVENEFPNAIEAKYPINLITIYDSLEKKYYSWALTDKPVKKFREDSELFVFDNEKDMLRDYIAWHNENMPDAWAGWNNIRFDTPYIINRCINILDENEYLKLSPEENIYIAEKIDELTKEEWHRCYIKGLTQFDMLALYRDKYLIRSPTNYSLGSIGQHELGISKIELNERMQDIWKLDFQKYYEYNLRDVEIVHKLEDAKKLIYLSRRICNMGLVPYEKIYSSIPYLTHILSMYAETIKKEVFLSEIDPNNSNETFKGGFVYPTEACFLNDGIATVDLNSLYPNTMIAINVSPETKIGKIIKNADETYSLNTGTKIKILDKEKVKELLKTKCTLAKNNTLFLKSSVKTGIIPEFLKYYYAERKAMKKEWAKVKKQLEKRHADDYRNELLKQSGIFEVRDFMYKAVLNSIYGMFGSKHSAIHDTDCAEAVTLTGQFVTKTAIKYVNDIMLEKHNIKNAVRAADTDSVMFDISGLLNEFLEKNNTTKNNMTRDHIINFCKILDTFVENDVNGICRKAVAKECFSEDSNRINFTREIFGFEAAFFAKKHYFIHIKDKEGIELDDFKYTGISVKQNFLPKPIKGILRELYEQSCKENWSNSDFQKHISEIWENFKKLNWEDVAYYKGNNTFKDYAGFLQVKKGVTGMAKAVQFYHQLLDKFNLSSKYPKIQLGEKSRFTYIKPNAFGIKVIAFPDEFPNELKEYFTIDYNVMFEKMLLKPLKDYCKIRKWDEFKPNSQTLVNIFDF